MAPDDTKPTGRIRGAAGQEKTSVWAGGCDSRDRGPRTRDFCSGKLRNKALRKDLDIPPFQGEGAPGWRWLGADIPSGTLLLLPYCISGHDQTETLHQHIGNEFMAKSSKAIARKTKIDKYDLIKEFLHSLRNYQGIEQTAYRMEENIHKLYIQPRPIIQNP
ncbi:hypothetical protein AAY473_037843 [Plecturocebus cupreus]